MPFIAIAVMISLFLGGTAAAAQSPVGHAAIDHVSSAWAHVESAVTGTTDIETNDTTEAAGTVETGSNTQLDAHGDLRIRSDADTEAQATDQKYNDEAALHAEHELQVNVF